MTRSERKIYIQCLVKIQNVQRRRGTGETSWRNVSLKYHLIKVDNIEIRVCKQMFLKTLGLKESTVLNWVKFDWVERKSKDKRNEVRVKMYESKNSELKTFLNSLPKVESHYCRSSNSKLYLEPMWGSTTEFLNFTNVTIVRKIILYLYPRLPFSRNLIKKTFPFIFQEKTCVTPAQPMISKI